MREPFFGGLGGHSDFGRVSAVFCLNCQSIVAIFFCIVTYMKHESINSAVRVLVLSIIFVLISYLVVWPSLLTPKFEAVSPSATSYDQELSFDEIITQNQTLITLHINPGLASSDKLNVGLGTTISWVNDDIVPHRIVSATKAFESGTIEPGEKFSYTFTDVGSYKYFCDIDSSVESEVNVH